MLWHNWRVVWLLFSHECTVYPTDLCSNCIRAAYSQHTLIQEIRKNPYLSCIRILVFSGSRILAFYCRGKSEFKWCSLSCPAKYIVIMHNTIVCFAVSFIISLFFITTTHITFKHWVSWYHRYIGLDRTLGSITQTIRMLWQPAVCCQVIYFT